MGTERDKEVVGKVDPQKRVLCKKAKRLSEEALQIAVKRKEAKSKPFGCLLPLSARRDPEWYLSRIKVENLFSRHQENLC